MIIIEKNPLPESSKLIVFWFTFEAILNTNIELLLCCGKVAWVGDKVEEKNEKPKVNYPLNLREAIL